MSGEHSSNDFVGGDGYSQEGASGGPTFQGWLCLTHEELACDRCGDLFILEKKQKN